MSQLTDLSSRPETPSLTADIFSTNVVDEVSRIAYLRLYSKHAEVVKNNLSKVSNDVDTLYSSVMAGFVVTDVSGGGTIGGGGLGGGGDTGGA